MLGQSVGPAIGGFITEYRGFHGIFWFLAILASATLTVIVVFLPETLQSIAGNGTIRLIGIHRPLILRSLSCDWDDNPSSHQSTLKSR